MKRRIGIAGITGLGGGAAIIDGKPTPDKKRNTIIRKCSKDCYETFFKGTALDYDMVDASGQGDTVKIGIEPSYQSDPLKIIIIAAKKGYSTYMTGIARGYYGSQICKKERLYIEYTKKSKFTRFIDRWHPLLFPDSNHDT